MTSAVQTSCLMISATLHQLLLCRTKRKPSLIVTENGNLLELEVNGQVGATGAVGGEDGREGREEGMEDGKRGERGLVEVKNNWMLWCWRMWQGRAVRHLGAGRETREGSDTLGVNTNSQVDLKTT